MEKTEAPLVSIYFARKMRNGCSDLLKHAVIHENTVYEAKKQDLYNSNKFDSLEIFVLTTFYFST